jgi:hypothetical protein
MKKNKVSYIGRNSICELHCRLYLRYGIAVVGQSQWLSGLRRKSTTARLLRVEVSATV